MIKKHSLIFLFAPISLSIGLAKGELCLAPAHSVDMMIRDLEHEGFPFSLGIGLSEADFECSGFTLRSVEKMKSKDLKLDTAFAYRAERYSVVDKKAKANMENQECTIHAKACLSHNGSTDTVFPGVQQTNFL